MRLKASSKKARLGVETKPNMTYEMEGRNIMARSLSELKGTKTEKNLLEAFAGESQAHTKYQFYAKQAKKDGYVQISDLFAETSANEKVHAKQWFKFLHEGNIPTTEINLADAAAGENYEWTDMYKRMAEEAREEGFTQVAAKFELVGKIEASHEERFRKLLHNVEEGIVFTRDGDTIWQCKECGHLHIGKNPPKVCPVCAHPQEYFFPRVENY